MNKNLRRSVAVLVTTLGCLALMASPASASTLTSAITGGTFTLVNSTGTITDTFPLSTAGTGCVNDITVDVNDTATSTTSWQITGYHTIFRSTFFGGHFIGEMSWTGSTAGTVNTLTGALGAATLSMTFIMYSASNTSSTATDCGKGTLRCRFNNVALSVQGTYSGDLHTPTASSTFNLTGSGTLGSATPPCTSPFSTYNSGTMTVAALTGHVTLVT